MERGGGRVRVYLVEPRLDELGELNEPFGKHIDGTVRGSADKEPR